MRCNGLTEAVDKATIRHLLEPKTRLYFHEFRRCVAYGKVYWQGAHYARMAMLMARITRHLSED